MFLLPLPMPYSTFFRRFLCASRCSQCEAYKAFLEEFHCFLVYVRSRYWILRNKYIHHRQNERKRRREWMSACRKWFISRNGEVKHFFSLLSRRASYIYESVCVVRLPCERCRNIEPREKELKGISIEYTNIVRDVHCTFTCEKYDARKKGKVKHERNVSLPSSHGSWGNEKRESDRNDVKQKECVCYLTFRKIVEMCMRAC